MAKNPLGIPLSESVEAETMALATAAPPAPVTLPEMVLTAGGAGAITLYVTAAATTRGFGVGVKPKVPWVLPPKLTDVEAPGAKLPAGSNRL